MFAESSDIRLIASNFTRNNATNGGVFKINGHLFIAHCIMNNNKANGDGGVGYVEENSKVNITTTLFRSNSAFNDGGVLWVRKSTVNVWNSSFVHNWAGFNGGVANVEYNSTINISLTTCFGNKGGFAGVFMAKTNTKLFVHNSKIQQNFADVCAVVVLKSVSVLEISLSEVHRNTVNINKKKSQVLCAMGNSLIYFSKAHYSKRT